MTKKYSFLVQLAIILAIFAIAQSKNYTLVVGCDTCYTRFGCPYNTCFYLTGGPFYNSQSTCANMSTSVCYSFREYDYIYDCSYANGYPCNTCCISPYSSGYLGQCIASSMFCLADSSSLSTGAIVGIVIGIIAFLAIAGGLIWYIKVKRNRSLNDINAYQRTNY